MSFSIRYGMNTVNIKNLVSTIGTYTSLGETGSTGPQGQQGFSVGAIYYFNHSENSDLSGFSVLDTSSDGAVESTVVTPLTNISGNVLVGKSYITDLNNPNTNTISPGIWRANIFAMV